LPATGVSSSRPSRWWPLLFFVLLFGPEPVVAQPASSQLPASSRPPAPSQSAPPPASAYRAESGNFQSRIDAAARKLAENPRYKNASPQFLQRISEFVAGNVLFVLLHELGHTAITEMGLPVLGKMEDAADSYAAVRLIKAGSAFSDRVLNEAAEGWFLADRRDDAAGDKVAYYDEHGLNQQRAYQIVCYMIGSNDEKFKTLAAEVKLPEERQDSCVGDYSNAAYSWDLLLKPHRRAPDQPKTKIDVVYGPATGKLETAAKSASSIRLLETVAEHAANDFAWPMPFTLEMQSCGFPNARWDVSTHKLTVCYELGSDFADLYRAYGDVRADGTKLADNSKRKIVGTPAYKPNRKQTQRKRKLTR
jgi:Putative metallopeptidase